MKSRALATYVIVFLLSLIIGTYLFGEETTSTAVTTTTSVITDSITSTVTAAAVVTTEEQPAAEAAQEIPKADTGDTAWILISAALVLFMTVPALALFYGGMSRKKNMLSTFYYSLSAAMVVSVMWVVFQYSMTFGGKDVFGLFGNLDKAFMSGITVDSIVGTIPESVFAVFQMTFAIITVALISGALVERFKFGAWIVFIVLWSLVVYTPLAHWVWSADGWIFKMGALDFAGGLVVHISSGVSALVAALFIGERVRYKKEAMLPSNIPYVFIGAAMLWVGWFGFNAGSALGANGLAGNAFLVTNTAAAMGAITWMVIEWIHHGKPSVIGAVSGLVAGLVAITPAAGFVDVKAAIIMGIIVSILCFLFVAKVKKALGYDDSLDAFGVHGIGGTFGAIATGLFANSDINSAITKEGSGLFYSGNFTLLTKQLISVGAAYALAIVGTLVILGVMRMFMKLRVEPQEEIFGLDLVAHGEKVD